MKKLKIGIVGFSSEYFNQREAEKQLEGFFKEFDDVEIVSGLTKQGIPYIAHLLAQKYKFKSIGISSKKALSNKKGIYDADEQIIIGDNYGDESKNFIDSIDILIRIGGGQQSRNEVEMFKQKPNFNKDLLIEKDVEWFGKTLLGKLKTFYYSVY